MSWNAVQTNILTEKWKNLDFISQYTTYIRYIKGQQIIIADALSSAITDDTLSYDLIYDGQKSHSLLTEISSNSSLKLKQFPIPFRKKTFYCDNALTNPRPYPLQTEETPNQSLTPKEAIYCKKL